MSAVTQTVPSRPAASITAPELVKATLTAALLAALANEIFAVCTSWMFSASPSFRPLSPGMPALASVIGVLLAGTVAYFVFRRSSDPVHRLWSIGFAALFVSFVPGVVMMANPKVVPGTRPILVDVLCFMHVIAFAIAIPAISRVAERRG